MKNGQFDLNNFFQKLSEILFKKIKLEVIDNNIKVSFPAALEDAAINSYKSYIKDNKKLLVSYYQDKRNFMRIYAKDYDIVYPTSFAQDRIWFVNSEISDGSIFNILMTFKYKSYNLQDIKRLDATIKIIIEKHEILRATYFQNDSGKLYQKILANFHFNIDEIQCQNKQSLLIELKKFSRHRFNLINQIPIKLKRFKILNNDELYLSIAIHHIAFDGWSNNLLLEELNLLYNNLLTNEKYNNELIVQYRDYAYWQKTNFTDTLIKEDINYWKLKLQDFQRLNIPKDSTNQKKSFAGKVVNFKIDKNISNNLKKLASKLDTTLYSILLSAYIIMLKIISSQNDIVIGTNLSNRNNSLISNTIGCFINILPVRVIINDDETIGSFINKITKQSFDLQLYQHIPFDRIVKELNLERDINENPIFQVIFSVQEINNNLAKNANYPFLNSIVESYNPDNIYNVSKFDISLFIDDSEEELVGCFEYSKSIFKEYTIENYIKIFKNILIEICSNENNLTKSLKDINAISVKEHRYLEVTYNNTEAENYCITKNLSQLFEENVNKNNDVVAVQYKEQQITYGNLNKQAEDISKVLLELNLQPGDPVVILLEPSIITISTILAILKAGGAYIPIDSDFPDSRVRYIFEDTDSYYFITTIAFVKKIEPLIKDYQMSSFKLGELIIFYRAKITLKLFDEKITIRFSNAAYILYTSGTTGRPKGIVINHNGLINRIIWMNEICPIGSASCVLQKTNYIFDVSGWEFFLTLLFGGKLIVLEKKCALDFMAQIELIKKNSVTIIHFIPSTLNTFLDVLTEKTKNYLDCLEYIFCSGEQLFIKDVKRLKQLIPTARIFNLYGPTEASIDVLYYEFTSLKDDSVAYIGKPINNVKVYILDKNYKFLPKGSTGELYISGRCLAECYLNNPEQTSQKFLSNPFIDKNDNRLTEYHRMYKTGDLVKMHSNNNIEFLSRIDSQVKLRGYRIEIDEITNVIMQYPEITFVYVCLKYRDVTDLSSKYLATFFKATATINVADMESFLSKILPVYMIPSVFQKIDNIPLTLTGKLDKKYFEQININYSTNNENYTLNITQEKLITIISTILKISKKNLDIFKSFFSFGGDSINTIQLVAQIRREFDCDITVKDVFIKTNLKYLAQLIDEKIIDKKINNQRKDNLDKSRLLPIQQWFFSQKLHNIHFCNQSFIISTPKLDLIKLKEAYENLVKYHEAFQLKFNISNKDIYQFNSKEDIPEIQIINLKSFADSDLQNLYSKMQSEFNIEKGPLHKVAYIYSSIEKRAKIYMAFHHLIIDVVSWKVLMDDLKMLYDSKKLPQKSCSIHRWSETLNIFLAGNSNNLDYWKNLYKNYPLSANLILDKKNSNISKTNSYRINNNKTSKLLQKISLLPTISIRDILLMVYLLSIKNITKNNLIFITCEGHGREDKSFKESELSRTVGWLTSMFPISIDLTTDISGDIINCLKHIKEIFAQIPINGIGYGYFLLNNLKYKNFPLPKIIFNYLGKIDDHDLSRSNWFISDEDSGINIDANNAEFFYLSLNTSIINQEILMSFSSTLNDSIYNEFYKEFQQNFEIVIESVLKLECADFNKIAIDVNCVIPANNLQRGMILQSLLADSVLGINIVQNIWQYHGDINLELLKKSFDTLTRITPALRLSFEWQETIIQIVDQKVNLNFEFIDLSAVKSEFYQLFIDKIISEDRKKNYNLKASALFRVYIIKSYDSYLCLFSNHHIILDGWSISLLIAKLHEIYSALINGESPDNFEEDTTYIESQKHFAVSNNSSVKEFWRNELEKIDNKSLNIINKISLENLPQVNDKFCATDEIRIIFQEQEYAFIKEFTLKSEITIANFINYAWHKVLSLVTGEEQTIVGTIVSGRNPEIANIENSIGMYINTVPMIFLHKHQLIIDELNLFQQKSLNLINNHNIDLAELKINDIALVDHLFIFENYPIKDVENQRSGLSIKFMDSIERINFSIVVVSYIEDDMLNIILKFDPKFHSKQTIDEILRGMKLIILYSIEHSNKSNRNLEIFVQNKQKAIINNENSNSDIVIIDAVDKVYDKKIDSKLQYIWQKILNIQNIEIKSKESFYFYGGNSILLIKLLNLINKNFNISIEIGELIQNKTFGKQLELIEASITNIKSLENYVF